MVCVFGAFSSEKGIRFSKWALREVNTRTKRLKQALTIKQFLLPLFVKKLILT